MSGESSAQKISDEPLSTPQSVVLLLLDGWGIAPEGEGNAINHKNSKNFIKLASEYPVGVLQVNEVLESKRYAILGADGRFSSTLNEHGVKQIYITESEKSAALIGSFVGPENEDAVDNIIISSPICDSYGDEPEMSIDNLSRTAVKVIRENTHGFILISVANLDSVIASGNLESIDKAIQKTDSFIGKIAEEVLLKGGLLLISSTCGNLEKLVDIRTDLIDQENTLNPVPLVIVAKEFKGKSLFGSDAIGGDLSLLKPIGELKDLPVTILSLKKIQTSEFISGNDLFKK